RDGSLRLDAQGRLGTQDGALVSPPVTVPRGTQPADVEIGADGTVTVGTRRVGTLNVVTVPNPSGLTGGADNLFQASAASGAVGAAPKTTTLRQGALEGSDVDMGDA